jgi:hypothetical protein
MNSDHRTASPARRWGVGVGVAAGAGVAAAMIGMVGAPSAYADDGSASADLGLLMSADADVTEAINVLNNLPGVVIDIGSPAEPIDAISQFEAIQTPLLSSDNSFLSGLGGLLFDGPDQQLNQASGAFLSAVQAYVADPSITNDLDVLSTTFQFDDSLFGSILPNDVGKVIDQLFDVGGFDTAGGGAADVGASASADTAGSAGADLATGFDLPF